VVSLEVAPDAVTDLGRVGPRLPGRVQGHDLTFADGRGEVVRERGNSALARNITGYERCPRDEIAPVRSAPGRGSESSKRGSSRPGRLA
jgi:hypothetical protein